MSKLFSAASEKEEPVSLKRNSSSALTDPSRSLLKTLKPYRAMKEILLFSAPLMLRIQLANSLTISVR